MAGFTYSCEALVLRKTRLGEADMIVRMIDERGSLLEAIAKGARRPQGSLSGRMELFNRVKVHCAQGKNLDVVKEARLVRAGGRLHSDPAYGSAASCVAEFAGRTIQPELEAPRYFDLTDAAFAALDEAEPRRLPALVAAYVFKASAMLGMKPSFARCVSCGRAVEEGEAARVSYVEGGALCASCAPQAETLAIPSNLLLWADALLASRFRDLLSDKGGETPSGDLLHMADQWALAQADVRLKSIPALAAYASMP